MRTGSVRRIVVVDDDPSIREVAVLALSLVGGHDVAAAADGADGLDLVRCGPTDALLLDVMMPIVDGPSILAQMRADDSTRDVPVIFLTAKLHHSDQSAWDGLGLAGVIAKPFDPMTLATEVADLLGWES
ncbi:response regulator [Oerskovia flava]|uniref:response regulator n=1 Tax=Oerskovia flava TaxID=2986422 RepID=UPI00223F1577|nr:response regulator [Oerskovia sp. JB1-3-2]